MLNCELTMFSLFQYPQAVQSLDTKIVSVLLGEGADPSIKDCNGQTAIHLAVYGDSLGIVSKLLVFGANIEETTEVKSFQSESQIFMTQHPSAFCFLTNKSRIFPFHLLCLYKCFSVLDTDPGDQSPDLLQVSRKKTSE